MFCTVSKHAMNLRDICTVCRNHDC